MSPDSTPTPRPASPRWLQALFAAAVLVGLGGPLVSEASAWLFPDEIPIPESLRGEVLNQPARDFTLRDLDGNPVDLSDFRGKTVFLNFWATWCPPCVEELPDMVALNMAMRGRDFVILAVSLDDGPDVVRQFFGGVLPDFPIVMDDDGRIARQYGTFMYPETYVVDGDGRLRARFVGIRKWDSPDSVAYFSRLSD
jgi:peroxiredoxin